MAVGERSIKVQYDPRSMGDMLANMWVSLTLPALGNGENYADQVGRHIFKSVTMRVDETEVEVFHGDWGVIFDELYLETSEKVANRFLVNRSLAFDASQTNQEDARYESEVVIPLNFFFSRKYATDEYSSNRPNRPYLPLCAMHRQKLEFDFEFHPQTFFANTATTLSLSSFDIITEEITVHPDERLFLSGQRQLLVTDIVRRHPELDIDAGSPKTLKQQLVPSIPVKAFHWFFRDTRFEDPAVVGADGETEEGQLYVHNRFNWSRDTDFDELNTFSTRCLRARASTSMETPSRHHVVHTRVLQVPRSLPATTLASHSKFIHVLIFHEPSNGGPEWEPRFFAAEERSNEH